MLKRMQACRKPHLAPLFDLRAPVGLVELDFTPLSAAGMHLRWKTFGPASLWAAGVLVGLVLPECSCACTSKLEWLLTHISRRLPVLNTMHWQSLVAEEMQHCHTCYVTKCHKPLGVLSTSNMMPISKACNDTVGPETGVC